MAVEVNLPSNSQLNLSSQGEDAGSRVTHKYALGRMLINIEGSGGRHSAWIMLAQRPAVELNVMSCVTRPCFESLVLG